VGHQSRSGAAEIAGDYRIAIFPDLYYVYGDNSVLAWRSKMSNIHNRFPKKSTWGEFSQRLCKFYGLPHGSKFVLVGRNQRRVRDDKLVSRKVIAPAVLSRAPGQRVRQMIDGIKAMLATDPARHGWKIEARDPRNQPIDTRTHLDKWRAMDPALTVSEREAKRMRKDEIEIFVRPLAASCIGELEEGLEEPESKVPKALLAELVEHYGLDAVRASIEELRI
jgi:hypothetical protein